MTDRRANLAHILNRYFHNYVLADRFAGWLLWHWEDVKREVEGCE